MRKPATLFNRLLQAIKQTFTLPLETIIMTMEHHPHPHDQVEGHEGDHDCPDHFHRCHTRSVTYGYMDCPDDHCCKEQKTVTRMKKVDCGEDSPDAQVQAYIDIAGNENDIVTFVADLGRSGWLIFFKHPV